MLIGSPLPLSVTVPGRTPPANGVRSMEGGILVVVGSGVAVGSGVSVGASVSVGIGVSVGTAVGITIDAGRAEAMTLPSSSTLSSSMT